jgi:nicotinate-nucleotide pyrophosphorylase (carboxylating)
MSLTDAEFTCLDRLANLALEEDLGEDGDLTSVALLPTGRNGRAVFTSRAKGVLAGVPAARHVMALVDENVQFEALLEDGAELERGSQVARVSGPMRSILTAERTALNFLQRLSGIATLTRAYLDQVGGLPCKLLDTRKTTPGWRLLEKYAVRQGGGHNHRLGLHDGVLIKDNHLAALDHPDPVKEAVRLARERYGNRVPVEVEVDTLEQFDRALEARPDIVLLDNMTPDQLREAVRRRDAAGGGILLEASGGVNLATVRAIAQTGVDRISVGALTHSAVALDIGLDYS